MLRRSNDRLPQRALDRFAQAFTTVSRSVADPVIDDASVSVDNQSLRD